MRRPHYEALAPLFEYPRATLPVEAAAVRDGLATGWPVAAAHVQRFIELMPGDGDRPLGPDDLVTTEEVFTRSFEVQAMTTLDVGYIAFGDDYKRAELLVQLKREQRDAGVECGMELPDHLPNVLRLLARWADDELAKEFVDELLGAAVKRMIGEFDPERVVARDEMYRKHYKTLINMPVNRTGAYAELLVALDTVLTAEFDLRTPADRKPTVDFLRSIEREMELEESAERLGATGANP